MAIRGNYSLDVGINFPYILEEYPELSIEIPDELLITPLVGNGGYELSLKGLSFNVSLAFNIVSGRIDSVNTSLSLDLGAIRIYFQDLVFNDELPFEGLWDLLNDFLTGGILGLWAEIEDKLTQLLDQVMSEIFEVFLEHFSIFQIVSQTSNSVAAMLRFRIA